LQHDGMMVYLIFPILILEMLQFLFVGFRMDFVPYVRNVFLEVLVDICHCHSIVQVVRIFRRKIISPNDFVGLLLWEDDGVFFILLFFIIISMDDSIAEVREEKQQLLQWISFARKKGWMFSSSLDIGWVVSIVERVSRKLFRSLSLSLEY
jgi:hypothetical protein